MAKRARSPDLSDGSDMIQPFKRKMIIDQSERKKQRSEALVGISKFLSVSDKYSKAWAVQQQKIKENAASKWEVQYFEGTLREYQIVGVKWMETLYLNAINGILADEMGLGKTIQVIAFLCSLHTHGVHGMHLISVPLSTLTNWMSEFKRFAPALPVIQYYGDVRQRQKLLTEIRREFKKTLTNSKKELSPIVIVPHHYLKSVKVEHFAGIKFEYLIIDEGHRIKNHQSQTSLSHRMVNCKAKLLLTGTPLQNNMQELWSLLNFIMPKIFQNADMFEQILHTEDLAYEVVNETDMEESMTVLQTLQRVLQPFMLRRLKADVLNEKLPIKNVTVYCKMTPEQIEIYKGALKSDMARLRGESQGEVALDKAGRKHRASKGLHEVRINAPLVQPAVPQAPILEPELKTVAHIGSMAFMVMMYRRIVDHPHLVNAPLMPGTPYLLVDETLVTRSGKMRMLDILLPRLIERGHKVIIFSTLVIMLDLIDDYLRMRDIHFARLTGANSLDERSEAIDRFNSDPTVQVFLLSTRAGGLGINLTSADTVIFYDNDWNPHADLQAQARCHRIGQTKPVVVYKLVAKDSMDEYVMRKGELKLRLEEAVMSQSIKAVKKNAILHELYSYLNRHGEETDVQSDKLVLSEEQLEKLLDRSDLETEMAESTQ